MHVSLVQHTGSDETIVRSARVSTGTDNEDTDKVKDAGLIDYLMRSGHGSPFEHTSMTFRVSAPIFVWREHMRHRAGWSYNETSGRYRELEPVFYIPDRQRKLVQTGKPGHYEFEAGTELHKFMVSDQFAKASEFSFECYQRLLDEGVAREVARMVLPLNIYSHAYVTCNARSLMHFLSLRTTNDNAVRPSHPQREIEMVAEQYEVVFATLFPVTHTAFTEHGRTSP